MLKLLIILFLKLSQINNLVSDKCIPKLCTLSNDFVGVNIKYSVLECINFNRFEDVIFTCNRIVANYSIKISFSPKKKMFFNDFPNLSNWFLNFNVTSYFQYTLANIKGFNMVKSMNNYMINVAKFFSKVNKPESNYIDIIFI